MIRWKLVGLQIVEEQEQDRAIDGNGDEIASGEFNVNEVGVHVRNMEHHLKKEKVARRREIDEETMIIG